MTYQIVRIDETTKINLKGWKIVDSHGDVLLPFTTRAEAANLLRYFGVSIAPEERS